MQTTSSKPPTQYYGAGDATGAVESTATGMAWGAILGGAFAAAGVTFILMALGSGLGFASVSPWSDSGATASTLTAAAAIWLVVVQWLSSGLGGYLTGRLRTKWVGVHNHEVFFRDTAHGFLTWAVATVAGAVLLASAVGSVIGGGAQAVGSAASGLAQGAGMAAGEMQSDPSAYFVDRLYRADHPTVPDQDNRAETGRIILNGLKIGDLPAADRTYLAQMVAGRTGLSQAEAEQRVDSVVAQAKDVGVKAQAAVDAARKGAAKLAIFTAISMLIGAFIAAAAAALGGRDRDEWSIHLEALPAAE